jgi:hypothetical protein
MECPAYGYSILGFQTEAQYVSLDLYNAQGGVVSGFHVQGQAPYNAGDFPTPNVIHAITWSGGAATATTAAPHRLTVGQKQVFQLYGRRDVAGFNVAFIPPYGNPPGWVIATPINSTQFTYDLPTNPGAYTTDCMVWYHPQQYAMRCRKVYDTAILGMNLAGNMAYASIDLDYDGDPNTQHRNNAFYGIGAMKYGIVLPHDRRNLAGWDFNGCVSFRNDGLVHPLLGRAGWNGPVTAGYNGGIGSGMVNNPEGNMTFSCLPGQSGVVQPGPYEGQEYLITDGPSVSYGALVTTTGTQKIRVRYTTSSPGPGWIRIA